MRKATIGLLLAVGILLAPVGLQAAHLCWDTGNFVDLFLTNVGGEIFEVNGTLNGFQPLAGTAIRGADEITLSFGIVQADVGSNAVVWQFNLDPVTLDGDGYFRWYDASFEGPLTVTSVPCPSALERLGPGDITTGIQ